MLKISFCRHAFCGVVALAAMLVPAYAQQAAQPVRQPVVIRVLGLNGMVTDLYVPAAEGRTRIVARATSLSRDIDAVATNGQLAFYEAAVPDASALPGAGVAEPAAAGAFAVRPDKSRYIVVLAGKRTDGAPRDVFAIADAPGDLPAGNALAMNFTSVPVAVQLDDDTAVIAPGESAMLKCSAADMSSVGLKLARSVDGGEWELITSTRTSVPAGRRLFLLITAPSQAQEEVTDGQPVASPDALQVKIISDLVTTQ